MRLFLTLFSMSYFKTILLLSLVVLGSSALSSLQSSSKINDVVKKSLETSSNINILVSMKDDAKTQDILKNFSQVSFKTRADRSSAVYNTLTARAEASQSNVLKFLDSPTITSIKAGAKVRSFWITNKIGIKGASKELIERLASLEGVSRIEDDEIVTLDTPITHETSIQRDSNEPIVPYLEWGVVKIKAPEVWNLWVDASNGSGIIVSNIDTGCRATHEILRDSYVNDTHSWFDPYDNTPVSADYHGHGTHTMGTLVGSNGYGVAPGAKWICCKGLDNTGSGSSSDLIACGQYLVCPTDYLGNNPDCSKTPHVSSNSWGGSGGRTLYDDMIAGWHAAGIIPVSSNGNSGPSCSTAGTPGDRDLIGVGSTTSADALASSSSIGPSLFGELKPDISAPGALVLSASYESDTAYSTKSGTSMACPHVAGAVAILLSRNPNLTYPQVKSLLQENAERNLSFRNTTCGGTSDSTFPNHHFGHGRLDVLKSYQALLQSSY